MPLINVKLIEGVLSAAQKQELVEKLTDVVVAIEGENIRAATVVIIEEVKSGDWGIGGKPMTTQDVETLVRAREQADRRGRGRRSRLPGEARGSRPRAPAVSRRRRPRAEP